MFLWFRVSPKSSKKDRSKVLRSKRERAVSPGGKDKSLGSRSTGSKSGSSRSSSLRKPVNNWSNWYYFAKVNDINWNIYFKRCIWAYRIMICFIRVHLFIRLFMPNTIITIMKPTSFYCFWEDHAWKAKWLIFRYRLISDMGSM